MDFNDLLKLGILELMDVNEENNCLIAMNENILLENK